MYTENDKKNQLIIINEVIIKDYNGIYKMFWKHKIYRDEKRKKGYAGEF